MILIWFIPLIVMVLLVFIVGSTMRQIIKPPNKFHWEKKNQIIIGWQNKVLLWGMLTQLFWFGYMIGKL